MSRFPISNAQAVYLVALACGYAVMFGASVMFIVDGVQRRLSGFTRGGDVRE